MPVRGIGIDVCKVERISESQRFAARLQSEQLSHRLPGNANPV